MTLEIPDDVALKLEKLAAERGETAVAYSLNLLMSAVAKPTIDELLAPVRADFARTGMTDEQILDFGRGLLASVRQEQKAGAR